MISDGRPLEEFLRDPEVRARLHREADAELLRVEGEPDLVVQDAGRYAADQAELERLRFIHATLEASRRMRDGGGRTLEEVETQLRSKHGL